MLAPVWFETLECKHIHGRRHNRRPFIRCLFLSLLLLPCVTIHSRTKQHIEWMRKIVNTENCTETRVNIEQKVFCLFFGKCISKKTKHYYIRLIRNRKTYSRNNRNLSRKHYVNYVCAWKSLNAECSVTIYIVRKKKKRERKRKRFRLRNVSATNHEISIHSENEKSLPIIFHFSSNFVFLVAFWFLRIENNTLHILSASCHMKTWNYISFETVFCSTKNITFFSHQFMLLSLLVGYLFLIFVSC